MYSSSKTRYLVSKVLKSGKTVTIWQKLNNFTRRFTRCQIVSKNWKQEPLLKKTRRLKNRSLRWAILRSIWKRCRVSWMWKLWKKTLGTTKIWKETWNSERHHLMLTFPHHKRIKKWFKRMRPLCQLSALSHNQWHKKRRTSLTSMNTSSKSMTTSLNGQVPKPLPFLMIYLSRSWSQFSTKSMASC